MEFNRKLLCYIFAALQVFIVCGIVYTSRTSTVLGKGPRGQYMGISTFQSNKEQHSKTWLKVQQAFSGTSNSSKVKNKVEVTTPPKPLESCPVKSPILMGYQDVDLVADPASEQVTEKANPLVSDGGHYKPPDCQALNKMAIIIPFRNRDRHLMYFLQYMHPILQRQQLEYRIYVMNQYGMDTFNKDKLMNVGYVEAVKDGYHCYAFHDVDVVLTNDHCPYKCMEKPVHLAHSIDKFGGLMYEHYFGGALAMSEEQFKQINGMSNIFWGWGGEDDDIASRIHAAGMSYVRHPFQICKYKMVKHQRDKGNEVNPDRFSLLNRVKSRYRTDGLNNLQYKIVQKDIHSLYTNITVDVLAPKR